MYPETYSMSKRPPLVPSRFRSVFVLALLLATFLRIAPAQNNPSSAEVPKPVPGTGITVQEQPRPSPQQPQTSNPPSTPVQHDSEPAKPITKAQAKELFRSVDEILEFVSQDTGLPIKHKVKRKLITRAKVESYVEKRLKDDKDAQRMEHEQLVLKKFGMIPQDYDLHTEFVKLLGEQVAAYYDSKTKTVNLLDWIQPELQRPVLAHELTHALQDQSVDLQVWARAGAPDSNPVPDQQEQVVEEAQAARQNVTEGQAMLAMFDYTLAPAGQTVLKAPEVVDAMRAAMTGGQDSPVLAAAPRFLQESLMMPYTFGFDFERAVLTKKGTAAAYLGALQHPPVDTLQVMEPQTYLDNKAAPPPTIPDLNRLISPDYQRYDFGGMGAFDVYLLVRQYAPKADAKRYYSHWSGGYYLAAHLRSAPKDDIALLYFSRWDSQDSAKDFAKLYSDYAPTRYKSASPTTSAASVEGDNRGNITYRWDFGSQGKVVIEVNGSSLLILEGFNNDSADRLSATLAPSSQATN
jgi:hypothetical protein